MPFLDSLDIANRGLQHCGSPQILSINEDSKANVEASFAYDKVRRAEMRRNTWRFSIRRAALRAVGTSTMILQPSAWSSTTTYLAGSIVADSNGQLWLSMVEDNTNNSPGVTEVWEMYFGPMTVEPYSATASYFAGELVYKAGATAGSYVVYQSTVNANSDVPSTATPWDAAVTYNGNSVVSYGGYQWDSLISVNLNITPAVGPLAYDATTTYTTGQTVTGSDHFIYSSVGTGNIGHDPVTDGGVHWTNTGVANAWQHSPAPSASANSWRVISATMTALAFSYPIGAGPASQTTTRNVYRLPAGFLRAANQAPKIGGTSYLGAPSGLSYDDWEYEGDYIVSSQAEVIVLRFVADIVRVTAMDDMFCEGLALRIALGICQPLTQSDNKMQNIASQYKLLMGEARQVNAIELGPVEFPTDDWIACRA